MANKRGSKRAEKEEADHLLLPHFRFRKVREALAEGEKCLNWTRVCCCSVVQSCQTLCDLMPCSAPGFPALHHLLEFVQTHVHQVGHAIRPSHPQLSDQSLGFDITLTGSLCSAWRSSQKTEALKSRRKKLHGIPSCLE